MEYLSSHSRIALGNRDVWTQVAAAHVLISIPPRDQRQPRASAVNESLPFGNCQACLERPIDNLALGCPGSTQRAEAPVFQRVRHDGLQDSAGSEQRRAIAEFFESAPAIRVRLLKHRSELRVVNEVKPMRGRRRL